MEAAYLFLLQHNDINRFLGRVSKHELEVEGRVCDYYLITFTDDEIIDPYRVLENCLKEYPPQTYRDNLHAWLHAALSTQTDFDALPPVDFITFHDCIKRLIDANDSKGIRGTTFHLVTNCKKAGFRH